MTPVILASASAARRYMLAAAGVAFSVETVAVDEPVLRDALKRAGTTTSEAAVALAAAKAATVSHRHPAALVLGADQILEHDGAWLEKPSDRDAARDQLRSLRGRSHRLVSAVTALQAGEFLWHAVDTAELDMRAFSDAFLTAYLDQAGDAVTASVGAYQLEGLGAQLFTAVRGDFFTVLGMPLLPLLDFLRHRGVLTT